MPVTFELAVELARPGGRIANIGVHGQPATLHLEDQVAARALEDHLAHNEELAHTALSGSVAP